MTINGDFTFDGVSMSSLGDVTVVKGETFEAPAREFDVREIPGRNGDMVLDGGKYPNVGVTYWVMIRSDFNATYRKVCGFLLSRKGYCKLSDSWNTDEFYLAYVAQPIQPTVNRGEDQGAFEVVFSRKPQRFLVSGNTAATLTPSTGESPTNTFAHLENPTYFPARPQIKLKLVSATNYYVNLVDLGLFTQLPTTYSNFGTRCVSGTRRAIQLYTGSSSTALSNYVSADEEIVIDCESRSVLNTARGTSLNAITYLTAGTGVPGTSGTVYFPDFPEIQPILSTDYVSCSMVFQDSYVYDVTVLPRWWTV